MSAYILALAFASSVFLLADARSDGKLSYCEISSPIGSGTSTMKWAKAPFAANVLNQKYSFRAGDGSPASDATFYAPNKLTAIHLRTTDLNFKYIGLLMYAVDSVGAKVGSWVLPPNVPFQITPTALCYPFAVTHTDSNLKPLHSVFYFMGPPNGTGTVTIKLLIKQGEQNKGQFLLPTPLSLTEGSLPSSTLKMMIAAPVSSCSDTCTASTDEFKYCDNAATSALSNSDSLRAASAAGLKACPEPFISGCSEYAPFFDSSSNLCVFKNKSCSAGAEWASIWQPTSCSALPTRSSDQRFCVCSSNPAVATSRASAHPALIWPVLASLALFTSRPLVSVAMLLFFLAAPTTLAHNWVNSPSRALVASVANPCQARINDQPHIQVKAGQNFQMEWSTGHGDSGTKDVYWVLIKESDYGMLYNLTTKMMDEYLLSAAGSTTPVTWYNTSSWRKRHLSPFPSASRPYMTGIYKNEAPITAANSTYIPRDPVMVMDPMNPFGRSFGFNVDQYELLSTYSATDLRLSYKNEKYPFIVAANRFRVSYINHTVFASQADLANFQIPSGQATGNYIYWFYWGGYKDCVDINVQATTVVNRYGVLNNTQPVTFKKLDHCEFTFVKQPSSTKSGCKVATANDASACIAACAQDSSCNNVQAVRKTNPPGTLPYTPNIPFLKFDATQVDTSVFPNVIFGPCGALTNHNRTVSGCTVSQPTCPASSFASTPDNAYICYGLTPHRDQDFQAAEDFVTTDDPNDPIFYSTCWFKIPGNGFTNIPPPAVAPLPWIYAEKCISCDFQAKAKAANSSAIVAWENGLVYFCANCDRPM